MRDGRTTGPRPARAQHPGLHGRQHRGRDHGRATPPPRSRDELGDIPGSVRARYVFHRARPGVRLPRRVHLRRAAARRPQGDAARSCSTTSGVSSPSCWRSARWTTRSTPPPRAPSTSAFPVIADTDIPEILPTGICTYEHVVANVAHRDMPARAVEVRGVKIRTVRSPSRCGTARPSRASASARKMSPSSSAASTRAVSST